LVISGEDVIVSNDIFNGGTFAVFVGRPLLRKQSNVLCDKASNPKNAGSETPPQIVRSIPGIHGQALQKFGQVIGAIGDEAISGVLSGIGSDV
jgi:hypothetical protein